MRDLQKANMWKRISAALFDLILLAMIAVGLTFLMTILVRYDARYTEYESTMTQYEAHLQTYEEEYGVSLDNDTWEKRDEMSAEEKLKFETAYNACVDDPETLRLLGEIDRLNMLCVSLILVSVTFGILVAYLLMELMIPLILRNGQTVGKKMFGLAVVREDAVRVSPFQMAVRTVLGKYTIEAMLPIFVLIMMLFNVWVNTMFFVGALILLALFVGQIILLIVNRTRTPIHDLFARTVVVDYQSQRIFATVEEREAYYRRLHEEMVARADY